MSFLTIPHNEDEIIRSVDISRSGKLRYKIVWFTETKEEAERLSQDPKFEDWKGFNALEFICWDKATGFTVTTAPRDPNMIIVQKADLIDQFIYASCILPLIRVKGVDGVVTFEKI